MQCKYCSGPLPPLSVAFDDPYCSRVCLEQDLYGHSDFDPVRSANAKAWANKLKNRGGYIGDGVLVSTLRSMGFSSRLQRRLGLGVAICRTCGEEIEGSFDELPWLAVLHVKESGHGRILDSSEVDYGCRPGL